MHISLIFYTLFSRQKTTSLPVSHQIYLNNQSISYEKSKPVLLLLREVFIVFMDYYSIILLPLLCSKTEKMEKYKIGASADDISLDMLATTPASGKNPKAIIQLVHGMCEHKERYIPFMEFLVSEGFVCVIHDHRGHGGSVKSAEDLGYFYDGGAEAMVEDIKVVQEWAKEHYPGLPVILFGHSMGSMAVRAFTKRRDDGIAGLIVCGSPSYNPASAFGKLLAGAYAIFCGERSRPKLIQKIAFGVFNRNFSHEGSPNAWICSDRKVVEEYDKDPLCSFQFTANGFRNLFVLMADAYAAKGWMLAHRDLPVLFVSGEDDPCMVNLKEFGKATDNMRKAGYRNVSAITYPGMRHEILNETGKAKVWNDILAFIEKTLNP